MSRSSESHGTHDLNIALDGAGDRDRATLQLDPALITYPDADPNEAIISVRISRRMIGNHRTANDPNLWQADIFPPGSDHHGLGKTSAEAMMNAVGHWLRYTGRANS